MSREHGFKKGWPLTAGGVASMIELFQYPSGPEPLNPRWEGIAELWPPSADSTTLAALSDSGNGHGESPQVRSERMLAEASQRSFEAGRHQGMEEGHLAEREVHTAADDAA